MDLKHFKPIAEDEHSYTVLHPSGKKLFVEKAKLSPAAHKAILHLWQGALVDGPLPSDPAPASTPAPADNQAPADPAPEDAPQDAQAESGQRLGISPDQQAEINSYPATDPSDPKPVTDDQAVDVARNPSSQSNDPLVQDKTDQAQLFQQQVKQHEDFIKDNEKATNKIAEVQATTAKQNQMIPSDYATFTKYNGDDEKLLRSMAAKDIDPQRLYHNASTGSKITAGIGLILSGMGSATTGQPNYAMKVIDDAINRDIDAQKTDQTKNMNLWKMNRESYQGEMAANLASRNQLLTAAQFQLESAKTSAMNPVNKLRAQQAIDGIKQEMLRNNMQKSLLTQPARGAHGATSALSGADPEMLVNDNIKDEGQKAKALEEIRKRKNIAQNGQAMFDAFEQAVKETSGVAGATKSMLPNALGFESPGITKLNNLAQPMLDTIDESVRQSGKDSFIKNVVPRGTDSAAQTQGRREAMKQWLHAQAAAPVSKSNYIDLDRFQNTSIPGAGVAPAPYAPKAPDLQWSNGHQYQKVQGGWKKVK